MSYNPNPDLQNISVISAGATVTEFNRFPVGIGSTGSVSLKYSNQPISYSNPLPVSLGSSNITITGDVVVGTTVSVTSSPENPVHNHITQVGTSGILEDEGVPYLPVGIGTVNIGLDYLPVGFSTLQNIVSVGNTVSISNTAFYITNPVTTVSVTGIGSTVKVSGTVSVGNTVSISNTAFYVSNPVTTVTVSGIGSTVTVQGIVSIGNTISVANTSFYVTAIGSSVSVANTAFYVSNGSIGINSGANKIGSVVINTGIANDPVSITNPLAVQVGFQTFRSVNTTPVTDYNPLPVYLPNIDYSSKNRLKVSPFETVFFNTFQYGLETDVWDTRVSLGGSATHDPNRNNVLMTVGVTTGSEVIRQTRNVLRYIPGRQSQATFAIIFTNPVAGIRRRIGIFDENDGFFFEDDGSGANGYSCVIRSSVTGIVTENRVRRNDWNGDKLDGLGISSITASAENQQLVSFDYEWYGAGQVRVAYTINGTTHVIHTFNHANLINLPWCRTPFLPIRCELTNVAGTAVGIHSMYQGSNSVLSEGTPDKLGIAQNIGSAVTGYTLATAQTYYPIISIRLKPTALKGVVLPTFFQAASLFTAGGGSNATTVSLGYKFIRNATLTGGTWTDMPDTNSFTQYNRTATGIGSDGIDLDSGFIIGGNGGTGIRLDKDTVYQIGRSGIGTISDTLTLAVAILDSGVTNAVAYGAMTWIEQR